MFFRAACNPFFLTHQFCADVRTLVYAYMVLGFDFFFFFVTFAWFFSPFFVPPQADLSLKTFLDMSRFFLLNNFLRVL